MSNINNSRNPINEGDNTSKGGILEGTKDTILGAIHYTQYAAHSLGEKIGILEPTPETKTHEEIDIGAEKAHNEIKRESEMGHISSGTAQYRHDVIDTGAEKAHRAVDKVSDTGREVKDTAHDLKEKAEDSSIKAKHHASSYAESVKESILDGIHYTQHAAHSLGEKIGILEPTLETKTHEEIDIGAKKAHNEIERESEIGQISEGKAQYRHDVIDTGAEKAHHAVDKVSDTGREIKDTAHDLKEKAEDSSIKAKHHASSYAESAKESILDGIHYTQHAAHSLGEKIGILEPTLETRMEQAKDKAEYYKERIQDNTAEDIKEKIEDTAEYAKEKERLSEADHFDVYMKAQDALYNTV